jgi:hypothetical protein
MLFSLFALWWEIITGIQAGMQVKKTLQARMRETACG